MNLKMSAISRIRKYLDYRMSLLPSPNERVDMSELEQYVAMLKRAGIEYDTFKRSDGTISIVVDRLGAMWHRFSVDGQLIDCDGAF